MLSLKNLLTPKIKKNIKKFLHILYRLRYNKSTVQTSLLFTEIGQKNSDIFFGYYDICPFDIKDSKLLFIRRINSGKENKEVLISYKELSTDTTIEIAKSYAWNWQQGSRLRWLTESEISFNDFRDGNYCNRIINIFTREERRLSYPLYDISENKKLGVSLDFERLGSLRPGYGYTCQKSILDNYGDDGIKVIDIVNNKIILDLPLTYFHKLMNSQRSLDLCYINHLSFNPDSSHFLFFWIEIINNYHKASLVVYNMNTKQLKILESELKVSHYVWEDNNNIICTAYTSPNECKYYRYSVDSGQKETIAENILDRDGHPSFINNVEIITDTYPDKNGYQSLFKFNLKNNTKVDILKIYSAPTELGEHRTDLHPRLNHQKSMVCIDARVKKNRKIYLIQLI
ncbi:MAG: hypothetical protein HDS13_01665 [Bacteroides sp.]|nr:hypothetical protein [Bacteroides sp.]